MVDIGLIVGIYDKGGETNFEEILGKMIYCQKHRNSGDPTTYIHSDAGIGIGMVNQNGSIYSKEECAVWKNSGFLSLDSNIRAFVDGIVLEVEKHRTNFNERDGIFCQPKFSEIIKYAYIKWGLDFMNHLEGEFACAIWDGDEKKLILARDPYGHKPLHYSYDNKKFIFSSEIKGILKGGILPEVDLVSMSDFLSINYIISPATAFKNIFQVSPGSFVVASKEGVHEKKYFEIVMRENENMDFHHTSQIYFDSLKNAVKKRMVSDETFCFLSGGLDSSAVLSLASSISSKPVHAISVGFEENCFNELEDAEIMAKHVGAKHHKIIARPENFFKLIEEIVFHYDSYFYDTSSYPTFFAAKLAREFTDIILTGDGPDQSMGGSSRYTSMAKGKGVSDRHRFKKEFCRISSKMLECFTADPNPSLLNKMRRKLYRDSLSSECYLYDMRGNFPHIVKKYMCTKEFWDIHCKNDPYRFPKKWFDETKGNNIINQYLYCDMNSYVPEGLMAKVDRMCMAHGLETMSPFYDVEAAQMVDEMPLHFKIHVSKKGKVFGKYLLREIFKNRLPEPLLNKKKQGFGIPLVEWLRINDGQYIKQILLDERTIRRGYFKKKSLIDFVSKFVNDSGDWVYPNKWAVVAMLTIELWHRKYID